MVCAGSSLISIRWLLPLVLLLVSIAVSDGADKADKAAAKKDTKGEGKSDKSSPAKKDSSSSSESADSNAPVLQGDPKYWTKLLGLGFSEGTLTPPVFSPDVLKYKLEIKSGQSKELLVTPMINTNKYELLYTPELDFNGIKEEYSPIENIEFKQLLNKTGPGPLDMTMTVDVVDPKSKGSLLGGGNHHKYSIQIIQAPDIEEILTATKIEVVGRTSKGAAVQTNNSYDPKSPHNEIRYWVGSDVETVDVTVVCPKEATGLKYNGRTWTSSSEPYRSQPFEGATKSILGQCIYKDAEWTKGQEMQRTYVITIARNSKLAGTNVDLRIWPPQAGGCSRIGPGQHFDTEDGTQCDKPVHLDAGADNTPKGCNKYKGKDPGWKCMHGPPSAQFVGTFDNQNAELVVINKPTGGRYRLWNGIPTQVPVAKDMYQDRLVLEAGTHQREYTFLFGPPPTCKTMHYADDRDAGQPFRVDASNANFSWMCPEKDGLKYEVTEKTSDLSCVWDPCKPENDFPICCERIRMPCSKYDAAKHGGPMVCPKGTMLHPENKCFGWPCKGNKVDLHHCCGAIEKNAEAKCSSMDCPADSVLSDDASELNCFTRVCGKDDESTCCQPRAICDSMTCPSGFSRKYNAALFLCKGARCDVSDRDTCCDAAAYCDTFQCPVVGVSNHLGWVPKPDAANIPCGGKPCIEWDTGICCNKMGFCGSFECPLGFYKKEGAERIPCEGGGMHNCTKEDDLTKCCQPAAKCLESNVCTPGYHFKVNAAILLCRSAECQPTDRELCCDLVNPFKAATSTRVIAGEDEGECKMLDSPEDFSCKATGHLLNLRVEYTFDEPVGNKVYMGETMIDGKVGIVKIPQIEVPQKQKTIHANVDSLVAGRGAVEHRLQIVVVPPDNHDTTPAPHEKKAAPAPASDSSSKAASSKGSTSDKDKGESKASSNSSSTSDTASKESSSTSGKALEGSSSSSDKASKESSSSSDKASKDSSSTSGKSNSSSSTTSKDSSSDSGTEEHALRALRQRRLTKAGSSSAAPSDYADSWVV